MPVFCCAEWVVTMSTIEEKVQYQYAICVPLCITPQGGVSIAPVCMHICNWKIYTLFIVMAILVHDHFNIILQAYGHVGVSEICLALLLALSKNVYICSKSNGCKKQMARRNIRKKQFTIDL